VGGDFCDDDDDDAASPESRALAALAATRVRLAEGHDERGRHRDQRVGDGLVVLNLERGEHLEHVEHHEERDHHE